MIWGYELGSEDVSGPMKLKEVTLGLKPSELRLLAQFLIESADIIEKEDLGNPGWHRHASDNISGWRDTVPGRDVIVALDEDTASSLSWDEVPRVTDDE